MYPCIIDTLYIVCLNVPLYNGNDNFNYITVTYEVCYIIYLEG